MKNKTLFLFVAFIFIIAFGGVLLWIMGTEDPISTEENTQNAEEGENKTIDGENTSFMFIQNATSGSMKPIDGTNDKYLLTLNNINPSTIYFSDRPERISGQAPMQDFLDGLGFSEDNPPNAAIEVLNQEGTFDVLVVELLSPKYDKGAKILTYEVTILKDDATGGLAHYNDKKSETIIESFENVALFIDDCPDTYCSCYTKHDSKHYTLKGHINKVGCCWDWWSFACKSCDNNEQLLVRCNKQVTDCKGECDRVECVGD